MNNKRGQSLFEIIVALAIFSLIAATLISMAGGGFTALTLSGDQTNAAALSDGGLEAIRSIHDRAWNESHYNQSGVELLGGEWRFLGEGTTEQIGKFLRTITFSTLCRDASQNIVSCPGLQIGTAGIGWKI
ncbi:MAG: prepilin-type N-terminal cleavage/methylation domain-containing protein [Candidatus Ryanbacteria bacterium]|nr:prepilin-type N-terminal cleavage/methylation domain-containing protein [Candidatus Ryanbacteria bacterium]